MNKHLRSIEIFHYVYGAMVCFGGIFMLALVALGAVLGSGGMTTDQDVPTWLGPVLSTLGIVLFVLIEAIGLLNIHSGRCIGKRKNRTFSMVVAAFNCLSIPLGLVLGIFTLVTLSEEPVKQEYNAVPAFR